ncbi:acyl-CoA dehydrogenase [Rhodococcus oxybenzonivorans]|uniref:acyl-CoA dehydrogenase n=1 Tax=Rhodococcus oxybenzonivorans TaxID=1990687 RepID=UPI002954C222|nr:acyl-CoA dehydrogenase [Rhodococcus oxybenzonivorans]MDV7352796.1 acyl-CoA dehydrogenase [Rhodococcus oxybenzonivorans]
MALAVTEEHRHLAAVGASHLARGNALRCARDSLRRNESDASALWKATADLGWMGLHIPERFGGSGFGLTESAVVLEAVGHELAPIPLLSTVVVSAVMIRSAEYSVQRRWLPGLADGSRRAAVGFSAGLVCVDGLLEGSVEAVPCAPEADVLLLRVGDDMIVVDPDSDGVRIAPMDGLDSTRSVGRVVIEKLVVPSESILIGAARGATTLFRTLSAAESVGSSQACLEMATDYARRREQFGRPIGAFEAVKHHCADMLLLTHTAVASTWDAVRSLDSNEAWFAAAVAATHALTAQLRTARLNIQVHGGIGFTWEHDAHLYLRRAQSVAAQFGEAGNPLRDIVDCARRGETPIAPFMLPGEAEGYRRDARAAIAALRALPDVEHRGHLVDTGYLVPHWPKPWGRAAGVVEQLVIEEEFHDIDVPDLAIAGWVALTIMQEGSPEQRARWIEDILRGDAEWCQMFSEPGAGSDAAAVRTTGRRVSGGWRVTGQKIWISRARESDWGLTTVRTDPSAPKHAGVTMMAIDLQADGVDVRPIVALTGDAPFNEVYLDEVFVPDSDVVGGVGDGWAVARSTLGNERFSIGRSRSSIPFSGADLVSLLDAGADDRISVREVGHILAEEHALRQLNLLQAASAMTGGDTASWANVTKLFKAEHLQRLTDLGMTAAGTRATCDSMPELAAAQLFARCATIAGGTSEVVRNTIAERLLGLPRDPLIR